MRRPAPRSHQTSDEASGEARRAATLLDRLRAAVSPLTPTPADPHRRHAAVLMLFDPSDAALPLLFVLRSDQVRHHANQIAFPGGSAEPGETDAAQTALREANEEVGLPLDNVEILGRLDPMNTAVSGFWLTPVVGLQRGPWQIAPDNFEVAEYFRITLADLVVAPHEVRIFERDNVAHDVHFFTVDGRVIWGVTGAIVHDLVQRLAG